MDNMLNEKINEKIKKEKEKIKENKYLEFILDVIYIALGAFFIAVGINLFLLPHKMTTGGASGIATVVYYLTNIPLGVTILAVNIPLFVIAITKLGLKFSIKTIISTVLLSVFIDVFEFKGIVDSFNADLFTSCLFGGIIVGIGLSLTFKAGASSGGSDLLAQIIYNLTSIQSISQILLVIEMVIISLIIIVLKDVNAGLYSIVAMYISTKMIDVLFEGVYYTREVTIISKNSENIINDILYDLKRGATVIKGMGAHSKEQVDLITCVVTRPQIAKLKRIIRRNDKKALIYITNINEAIGQGFKEING